MIYTGNYKNCNTKTIKTFSISMDGGKDASYNGPWYEQLAPKENIVNAWKENIKKISELDNNKFYIYEYYNQVLKKLDPNKVYKTINNSILLCYEDPDKFSHRHIVSAWLEYYLNIKSFEVKIKNENFVYLSRPQFIKDYLNEVITEDPLIRKRKI